MNRKISFSAALSLALAILFMSQFVTNQSHAVQTVSGGNSLSIPTNGGGIGIDPNPNPCLGLSGSALCSCQGKMWCSNTSTCKPAGSSCYTNPCGGMTGQALCSCQNKFWCSSSSSCVNSIANCSISANEVVGTFEAVTSGTTTGEVVGSEVTAGTVTGGITIGGTVTPPQVTTTTVLKYYGCNGTGNQTLANDALVNPPLPHDSCTSVPCSGMTGEALCQCQAKVWWTGCANDEVGTCLAYTPSCGGNSTGTGGTGGYGGYGGAGSGAGSAGSGMGMGYGTGGAISQRSENFRQRIQDHDRGWFKGRPNQGNCIDDGSCGGYGDNGDGNSNSDGGSDNGSGDNGESGSDNGSGDNGEPGTVSP